MKTAHLVAHGAPPDVVKIMDVEEPRAGPGQAVVRIMACGINPADLLGFEGRYPGPEPLPAPCGIEGAGVVESVGEGSALAVGDHELLAAALAQAQAGALERHAERADGADRDAGLDALGQRDRAEAVPVLEAVRDDPDRLAGGGVAAADDDLLVVIRHRAQRQHQRQCIRRHALQRPVFGLEGLVQDVEIPLDPFGLPEAQPEPEVVECRLEIRELRRAVRCRL